MRCSLVILSIHAHLSIRDYKCLHGDNLVTGDKFAPGLVAVLVSYHALLFKLLLVDMDHNRTIVQEQVLKYVFVQRHCSLNKKSCFHNLICVIQFFMRKISWFSSYIHEIFLTLNYFRTTVCYA